MRLIPGRSDKRNVFTDGLTKLGEKVKNRFYTTALSFVNDLSSVFSAGISNEPPVKSEVNEADKTSPSKKHPLDMRERKRLAKRIIKAVQPQLEKAVQVESEFTGQPVESALKELEQLLEASSQARRGSVTISMGESGAGADIEMVDVDQNMNGDQPHLNGESSSAQANTNEESNETFESVDVEMEDVDASHKDDLDAVVVVDTASSKDVDAGEDTITTVPLAEVNGNKSPTKNVQLNGVKNESLSPTTNGCITSPEKDPPGPPTPPISIGNMISDQEGKFLTDGGVPTFLLKDFHIDGTHISETDEKVVGDEPSDVDEDEINGLKTNVIEADPGLLSTQGHASPAKTKKGKAKKGKKASKR